MSQSDVLGKCQEAADAIAGLPRAKWAGWVCWILEALDNESQNQRSEFDIVLWELRTNLDTRSREGRW